MRLGGTETIKVDVRILAASNVDLLHLGARRPLPRGPLSPPERDRASLPPLRERREDIPLLLGSFPAPLLGGKQSAAADALLPPP